GQFAVSVGLLVRLFGRSRLIPMRRAWSRYLHQSRLASAALRRDLPKVDVQSAEEPQNPLLASSRKKP
ncbi:MAG: hypothetical protein AAFR79_18130, partial [Pseudomonadota bacterium]